MAGARAQQALWSTPVDPAEHRARFRSLAGISASFLGSGHPLVASLRSAESGDVAAGERAIRDLDDVPALTRRRLLSVFGAITWPSKRTSAPTRNTRRAVRHTIMEMTMRMSDAFHSKFFKAADLNGGALVRTVGTVAFESMNDGEQKPVARFSDDDRGLVLNKTNFGALAQLAKSDDTANWRGMRVQLYAATAEFSGRTVPAVRIRSPHGAAPKQSQREEMDDQIPF